MTSGIMTAAEISEDHVNYVSDRRQAGSPRETMSCNNQQCAKVNRREL